MDRLHRARLGPYHHAPPENWKTAYKLSAVTPGWAYGYVDAVRDGGANTEIIGWAVCGKVIADDVILQVESEVVSKAIRGIDRPDVAAATGTANAGFTLMVPNRLKKRAFDVYVKCGTGELRRMQTSQVAIP